MVNCARTRVNKTAAKPRSTGPFPSLARSWVRLDIIKVKISVNALISTAGKVFQGQKIGLTIGVRERLTMRPGKASPVGDFLAVSSMLRFPSRIHFQFGTRKQRRLFLRARPK